ncbi:MAG: NAD(P)-binding domain-containing protein [Bacteroidota bacterium]
MKTVGIIGSGAVGKALARGFLEIGHQVTVASRRKEARDELQEEIPGIRTATPEDTARDNELIVYAVKGTIAKEALKNLGFSHLKGKVVIDATNPISNEGAENGVIKYFSQINKSLMEELQAMAPEAYFVKAFSCVGSLHMFQPKFEHTPSMFICGDHQGAKDEVAKICKKFGWEVEDMGSVEAARAIEPLAMLWCIPGFRENRWSHAFKLLKQ